MDMDTPLSRQGSHCLGADSTSGINRVSRFSNSCLSTPYLESVALRQLDKFAASGTDLRNNVDEAQTATFANAESIGFLAINRQTYYLNFRRST